MVSETQLGRSHLVGDPVADAACAQIVSIGTTQAMQLKEGERLLVKVWLPKEEKEFTLSLDTTQILKVVEK